jgi:hypothetical protein
MVVMVVVCVCVYVCVWCVCVCVCVCVWDTHLATVDRFEDLVSNLLLDLVHSVLVPLGRSLPRKRPHVEAVGLGRHDDEGDDSDVRVSLLEEVVEPRKCLDEQVAPLVSELVTTRGEDVQRLVQVKVKPLERVCVCVCVCRGEGGGGGRMRRRKRKRRRNK